MCIRDRVINTATGPAPSYNFDVSREEVAAAYGTPWEEMEPKTKGEKIDYMKDAVAAYVEKLYTEGKMCIRDRPWNSSLRAGRVGVM